MLLGDSSVGKTCLLVRFKDGAFLGGNFIATVGIDFRVRDAAEQPRSFTCFLWAVLSTMHACRVAMIPPPCVSARCPDPCLPVCVLRAWDGHEDAGSRGPFFPFAPVLCKAAACRPSSAHGWAGQAAVAPPYTAALFSAFSLAAATQHAGPSHIIIGGETETHGN